MPSMTDPSTAMLSFQKALLARRLRLEKGRVTLSVHFHMDQAAGKGRFTYVQLDGQTVVAFATFVQNCYFNDRPNFAAGYAVPEAYRNQGRAKSIFRAGIAELQNGFRGHPPFYVEAVVSVSNRASLKVAEAVLGGKPEALNDELSGEPALRYAHLFETVS